MPDRGLQRCADRIGGPGQLSLLALSRSFAPARALAGPTASRLAKTGASSVGRMTVADRSAPSRSRCAASGVSAYKPGALAQLGEHLLCKQRVIGSIPIGSTTIIQDKKHKFAASLLVSQAACSLYHREEEDGSRRIVAKGSQGPASYSEALHSQQARFCR